MSERLSPVGLERMEAMVPVLRREVARSARRRRAGRAVLVACTVFGVTAFTTWIAQGPTAKTTSPHFAHVTPIVQPEVAPRPSSEIPIDVVSTDTSILDRLVINDVEVQRLLHEAKQPPGLIRVGGGEGRIVWEGDLLARASASDPLQ